MGSFMPGCFLPQAFKVEFSYLKQQVGIVTGWRGDDLRSFTKARKAAKRSAKDRAGENCQWEPDEPTTMW